MSFNEIIILDFCEREVPSNIIDWLARCMFSNGICWDIEGCGAYANGVGGLEIVWNSSANGEKARVAAVFCSDDHRRDTLHVLGLE